MQAASKRIPIFPFEVDRSHLRNRTAHAGKKKTKRKIAVALSEAMYVSVSELVSRSRRHETRGAGIGGVDRRSRSCGATGVGSGALTSVAGVATDSGARSPADCEGNKTTLFPVLASREAPWRTRGTSTSRARYVVFTRASLRLMRLWTSARVVSRQRPSPTRRRTRFRRVSGTNASFRRSARTRAIGIDRDAIVRPRETSRLTSAIKTPKPPPYPTTGGAIVRHTAGGSRAGPTVRPRANRRGAPEPCFRRTSERVESRESSSSSRPRRGHDPSFSLR